VNAPARVVWETVAFKIPYAWLAVLDDWCEYTGKSRSQVLREALQMYFMQIRKQAIEAGLIDQFGNHINKKKRKGR
jgi:metal-responsive CopG/Arc/MetJ family transcriptional regulator